MLGSGLGAGDWKNKLEMIPDLMEFTAQERGNKKSKQQRNRPAVGGQLGWLGGLAPPSAQGLTLGAGDRVPCRVPCVKPASPSACVSFSLSLSLSVSHE